MATASLSRHVLPGVLGDVLIDLKAGDRSSPRPAVVIMHGFKGFKDWGMFPLLGDRVARAGMVSVSFNVSGSGADDAGDFSRPDQFSRNTYSAELEDLHRTIVALRSGQLGVPAPASIGLLGHSRGGGMAILEATRNSDIAALVTWAAIGSVDRWSREAREAWRKRGFVNIQNARTGQIIPLKTDILDDIDANGSGTLDIESAAARITQPWLILHGDEDESVKVDDAIRLHHASGGKARLRVFSGAGHTFGATHPLKEVPPALDQAINESVGWFSRYLS